MSEFAISKGASSLTTKHLANGEPVGHGGPLGFGGFAGGGSRATAVGPRSLLLQPHRLEVAHLSAPATAHLGL